ncbi:MAG: hypothetical protein WC868_08270 [Bacteroidales bacterium]
MEKTKKHKFNFDIMNSFLAIFSLAIAVIALLSVTKVKGFEDLLNKTSENTLKLNAMIIELKN